MAHVKEQEYGYKTGDEITAERSGGDYAQNLITIKSELAQVAEANAPMGAIKEISENLSAVILGKEIPESEGQT
jgi:hypothetical protein